MAPPHDIVFIDNSKKGRFPRCRDVKLAANFQSKKALRRWFFVASVEYENVSSDFH